MLRVGVIVVGVVLGGLLRPVAPQQSPYTFTPPSWPCSFQGAESDLGEEYGEVELSVGVEGNPTFYVPGNWYQVSLTSSSNFNGLFVNGLFTSQTPGNSVGPPDAGAPIPGVTYMCSLIHQQMMRVPQRDALFYWIAPEKGSGCVNFVVTAFLGQQMILKDALALQLCERGMPTSTSFRPQLASVHSDGVILRDDFDSSAAMDYTVWSEMHGGNISRTCGTVLHGNAMVFCNHLGRRELSTAHLNLTSASVLQFALSSGVCKPGVGDYSLSVSYAVNDRVDWHLIQKISVPTDGHTTIHIIHLPREARQPGICLRLHQDLAMDVHSFYGCWALDNVLITSTAHRPTFLEEDFDPIAMDNWLFFPGGNIRSACQSEGDALFFQSNESQQDVYEFVTTHDLNLYVPASDLIIEEHVDDNTLPTNWNITGGHVSEMCGIVHSGSSLVFNGDGDRLACTQYIDATEAGNIRFYFSMGGGSCDPADSTDVQVDVLAQVAGMQVPILLSTLAYNSYRKPQPVSVSIPTTARSPATKFCLQQQVHHGLNRNVWAVDEILISPWQPDAITHHLQFDINLDCGVYEDEDEDAASEGSTVHVEYSTDRGRSWSQLRGQCLPETCQGSVIAERSVYGYEDVTEGWTRVILPMPSAALTANTRFRWRQGRPSPETKWGIDNVYIGDACPYHMCTGHGRCTSQGCRCDSAFTGDNCSIPASPLPTNFKEDFETFDIEADFTFSTVRGAVVGYDCGVLASGKALVFNQASKREIVTQELNSTNSRFLQFTVRIGSHSSVGTCASPDDQSEGLLLFYSCNNGIEWHLLKNMQYDGFKEPRSQLVHLPAAAKGNACRFRWWQPSHSGSGHDVWALDGISLTSVLYNTINLNMSDGQAVGESLSFHLGEIRDFCKANQALVFSGSYEPGGIRYVETQSLQIGASYILQFDLVMGCGRSYAQTQSEDKTVHLEYSTDHGLSWQHVIEKCLPGQTICQDDYHSASAYDYTQYGDWSRVSVLLPPSMRTASTRFRWRQSVFSETDSWAIDNIYIGRECPKLCHGHGQCVEALCRCDGSRYSGADCTPSHLPSSIQSDFDEAAVLFSDWRDVHGGMVTSGEDGCGIVTSGSSLYFYGPGVRELVSHDLNTASASFVQFYIRLGGDGQQPTCRGIDRREEGVLLQYSSDGGITWTLLLELYYTDYRAVKFVHQKLPASARTASTRFRWWQPTHSGAFEDQWALDDVYIGNEFNVQTDRDIYVQDEGLNPDSMWMTVSNGELGSYCSSSSSMRALVFNELGGDRFAVTRKLILKAGDVVQFKIVIGCLSGFTHFAPIHLQYSHDNGVHWSQVVDTCYPSSLEEGLCAGAGHTYQEGSIYHMGQYAYWRLVVIRLPEHVTQKKTQFRWWQAEDRFAPTFSIGAVYIGESCPDNCHGRGTCREGRCHCEYGYAGDSCLPLTDNPTGIIDKFDDDTLGALWDRPQVAAISQGCGVVMMGNSLYFGSAGPREARTVSLNTTTIKILQFYLRIGSADMGSQCMRASSRSETVIVQFSVDNGITWLTLQEMDPTSMDMASSVKITMELPMAAKTHDTVFRWWQPFISMDSRQAQWALDNVLIGANDTRAQGFYESFDLELSNNWYSVMSGTLKTYCRSRQDALVFDGGSETPRYAETWDFEITPATFLQFEIVMGCGHGVFPADHSVALEYSTDMGRSWHKVKKDCIPPDMGCGGYDLGSVHTAEMHSAWTRVNVYLPKSAVSPSTRFRWSQPVFTGEQDVWALDSIHLGLYDCPWMCSGHGGCQHGQCVCDDGFGGSHCVAEQPLPKMLKDTFEGELSRTRWTSSYGVDIGNMCGILLSGTAAVFRQASTRMLVTQDLDCTMMQYMQFTFQYGCSSSGPVAPDRSHAVLVQYSNNGGTTWVMLQELHYTAPLKPSFFNIKLPMFQNNATKFRFWQPNHSGINNAWAVDGLIIGGNMMYNNILTGDFDSGIAEEDWLFYPGGRLDRFCPPTEDDGLQSTQPRLAAGISMGLVYQLELGEHSVTTRDIDVNENTMVQFEINVGCTDQVISANAISLEYSRDYGSTWNLLKPDCFSQNWSSSVCSGHVSEPSVYYIGELQPWKRVNVLINGLHICGTVRFRWYQGFYGSHDQPRPWALDNVYIGPLCPQLCNGHGACLDGYQCHCDEGYGGSNCYAIKQKPRYLKDEFEDSGVDSMNFLQWSGGEVTSKCGTLITGTSLHFVGSGKRMLVTRDLDLTAPSIVHFFIRLGCRRAPPSTKNHPVLLQFSTNGGITWNLVEEMDFNNDSNVAKYVMLELPNGSRSNTTRVRWWQPSQEGSFHDEWAIDQIFIGVHGQAVLQDDFDSSMQRDSNEITSPHDQNWILSPGGVMEQVCDSGVNALHFGSIDEKMRFMVSTDITVTEQTFLQFELSMGCTRSNQCYSIDLEYSVDMGKHWQLVYQECLPSDIDCTYYHPSSQLGADVYAGWNRVVMLLPAHTWSKSTQFRWHQPNGFEPSSTWALSYVYIGSQCHTMCTGHGRCNAGYCVCDSGWQGPDCEIPIRPLPQQVREPFSHQPVMSGGGAWLNINGGMVTSSCGPVASGNALHFTGACTRQLTTTDLDLSTGSHVQFYLRYGCITMPTQRRHNVLLQYSTDGGVHWVLLSELHYSGYSTPSFASIKLPAPAKTVGTRFSWWQPSHPGANHADWAIDNILIGGSSDNHPTTMSDSFDSGLPSSEWLFLDNAAIASYCDEADPWEGSNGVMNGVGESLSLVGGMDAEEDTVITTIDLQLQEGTVLEFKISTGCNASWDSPFNPLYVVFSTDHGITWSQLVQQCLPSDPQCNGVVTPSSSYYSHQGWRRVVVPLPEPAISGSTRLRWLQVVFPGSLPQRWALDDISIGPACLLMCSGHGSCDYPQCICDDGFDGLACEHSLGIRNGLKESFLGPDIDPSSWDLVQGGRITMTPDASCGTVSEGWSLYFSGTGFRVAETVDMDLRDASFVQYHAVIGSELDAPSCHRPADRSESVLLQYSTDGGITWSLIAELYYERYTTPQRDYFSLPTAARTQATRLRWWQPVGPGQQAQWALDDIYIGGSEINPNHLAESFDVGLTETLWDFYPYGRVRDGVCLNENSALYWANEQSGQQDDVAVTRQLIVDSNYMLQFKIVVGCQASPLSCVVDFPVNLEYRTDPALPRWTILKPSCLPDGGDSTRCEPREFDKGSVFTANEYGVWKRMVYALPPETASSSTQFRWIQQSAGRLAPVWSLDDVYIGVRCPSLCSGHGRCGPDGRCRCDPGFIGDKCIPMRPMPHRLNDNFEGGISERTWASVRGGQLGMGCGSLVPHAHGKSLYFSRCGMREVVTVELDTNRVSEITFVLQIGSTSLNNPSCSIDLTTPNAGNKAVLLQYTTTDGIDWHLIESHGPADYQRAQRVSYRLPERARGRAVRFRWWQPQHDGPGKDQWALDHVQLVMMSRRAMLNPYSN